MYGVVGIPTEGVSFEHGQIQFKGNLLQEVLSKPGGYGAITFGEVGIYPRASTGWGPDRIQDPKTGVTLGFQESFHSQQARVLGPLYLPAHLVGGILATILDGRWHGPTNIWEQGPHANPPRRF